MIIELISLTLFILHKLMVPSLVGSAWALYVCLRQISDYQTKKPLQPQTRRPSQLSISARPQPATEQRAPSPTPQTANLAEQPPAAPTLQDWVKPETRKRMFAMCGGDENLVRRLTGGSGEQAAWEKAIYYLERDRG